MQVVSDILMTAGTFAAAFYCYVLSRRLKRFQTLEGGLGGAIAVLSAQVDDMTRALDRARAAAEVQSTSLDDLTRRGEAAAARLELLLASLHDLPDPAEAPPPPGDTTDRRPRLLRRRPVRPEWEAAE
ncbi:MAG: hypothetical protein ACK4GO_12770 [Gemmobacter sp.]